MPLTINITDEYWDNAKQEFIYPNLGVLVLEHSLLSISKWEAKWKKPYLGSVENRTTEEALDYVRCMSIKGEPDELVLNAITNEDMEKIVSYIEDPMTATTVKEDTSTVLGVQKNFITSELLYSYMVNYRIPIECERWHLNRLLILIKVLNEQNKEPKKRSERELVRDYAKIREANRAKFHI
jgi:hypothetical protein